MTLYLVVASLLFMGREPDENTPRLKPSVEFHLSQEAAARSYFSQKSGPTGAARLFKLSLNADCWHALPEQCVSIKELNVMPAQSYEVSERETIEVKP